jgi:hypothetical protein
MVNFTTKTSRASFPCIVALASLVLAVPVVASPPDHAVLASPDHPRVWYVYDYDKLGQNLSWDERSQSLVANVTYSLVPAIGDWRPADYKTFTLHFPAVKLNVAKNNLYFNDGRKHKVPLGHLESGTLGPQVVLEKGVELSANRHNGTLDGALIINRPSAQ